MSDPRKEKSRKVKKSLLLMDYNKVEEEWDNN